MNGTIREVRGEQPRLREVVQTKRSDVGVAIMFNEAGHESLQVPDEQIMKLAFIVGDHHQVYMIFPVVMLGNSVFRCFRR